ncbi:MAG: CHASE2 domain-containing protein [Thiobacillaceae bacterium]
MKSRHTFDWLVPVAAVMLGAVIFVLDLPALQVLRNTVFDQYQRWAPRVYSDAAVRIVDIDDASLARLGQWPWPRTRIAELVDRLRSSGAAAVVFDMMFAEPDRTSPTAMLALWKPTPGLRAYLTALPDHDSVLANSIGQGGVVLGYAVTREGPPPSHFAKPFRTVDIGPSPLPFLNQFNGAVTALPALQDAAAGNGAISFIPDSDGVVRRVPLLLRLGDGAVPSLVAEALRVAQGAHNYVVRTAAEAGAGLQEIRIGNIVIPTTAQGEIWVKYTKRVAARYIPAWKVFAGQAAEESVRDHILLVGSSAAGLMDLRFSPLGGILPGVEVHAQALEQMIAQSQLSRPNWAKGLEMLVILAGGLVVGFLGMRAGALLSATAAATTIVAMGWVGWYAYSHLGLLLDPVTPGVTLLLIFILTSLLHHATTEHRQRWLKQAFAHYVSPNLVTHLVENPDELELGGTRRECSFIFTDLTGFTNLMERLNPELAVSLLNGYLDNMIRIAFQYEGTLDRIVGDAVAIMFSAPVEQPDHRSRAMHCALEMHRFAGRYAAEANGRGIPFGATRMGIHTGEVTVGNFGGSTIFDYRALGDPVNTAARLETVNKQLGTLVCVSEATVSGCDDVPARPVGRLVLKGKTEPLLVYEPMFTADGEVARSDSAYAAAYTLMAQNDPGALEAFKRLAAERSSDPLVSFHLQRLGSGQMGEVIIFTEK